MSVPQSFARRVLALRDRDQMDMIRHQRVGPNRQAKKLACLGQQFEIDFAVSVIGENRIATNPSLGDVMRKAGNNDTVKLPHFCGQFTAFESSHI